MMSHDKIGEYGESTRCLDICPLVFFSSLAFHTLRLPHYSLLPSFHVSLMDNEFSGCDCTWRGWDRWHFTFHRCNTIWWMCVHEYRHNGFPVFGQLPLRGLTMIVNWFWRSSINANSERFECCFHPRKAVSSFSLLHISEDKQTHL